MDRVLKEVKRRCLVSEQMSNAVQGCPIFLEEAVSRLAIVNDDRVKGTMDESVRVGETNPLAKGAETLSICVIGQIS